jgi:hypothetical protein
MKEGDILRCVVVVSEEERASCGTSHVHIHYVPTERLGIRGRFGCLGGLDGSGLRYPGTDPILTHDQGDLDLYVTWRMKVSCSTLYIS